MVGEGLGAFVGIEVGGFERTGDSLIMLLGDTVGVPVKSTFKSVVGAMVGTGV